MSQQLKNQQSIQILRANENYDPNISETILLYGQPFYSKKNQQLYVGVNEHIKNTSPIGAANIKPSALINNNKEPGEKNFSAESMRALNTSKNYQGANGVDSFAFGRDLTAGGEQSVSFGASNISNNNQTFVSGQTNKVLGKQSFGTGGNVEVYSDQGFVANSKNINLGVKSAVFGENNFVGGSKSLVSGNWNTESYFALDIVNKKLYKSWSNPLNTSNNILSNEYSELISNYTTRVVTACNGDIRVIIEDVPKTLLAIKGTISGGGPTYGDITINIDVQNIDISTWKDNVDGSGRFEKTVLVDGIELYLRYYPETSVLEINCTNFIAGTYSVNLTLFIAEETVNITGTINDRVIGTFKIDSTTYYLGYDYYDNLLVGTGTKTIKDKDGNDKVVVRPEKARCYKWKNNSNVLLFSLALDTHIPYNNFISGDSNKIKIGNNNIVSGNVNDIISGSNNLVSGAYNDINGNDNIIAGIINKVNGNYLLNIGANNEFLIDGGEASAALGVGLQINRTNQTVIGKYNQPSKTALFIVAGGSKDNRKNFFTIMENGATVVPKIPTSPHEVLRYSDFISTNGKLSTENGFDVSFNTTTASKFINKITGEDLIEKIKELENKEVEIVVDSTLDANSTNPVQNKVIVSELNSKVDKNISKVVWSDKYYVDGYGAPDGSTTVPDIINENAYLRGTIRLITELSADGVEKSYNFEAQGFNKDIPLGDGYTVNIIKEDLNTGEHDPNSKTIKLTINSYLLGGSFQYSTEIVELNVEDTIIENKKSINQLNNDVDKLNLDIINLSNNIGDNLKDTLDNKADKEIIRYFEPIKLDDSLGSASAGATTLSKTDVFFDKPKLISGSVDVLWLDFRDHVPIQTNKTYTFESYDLNPVIFEEDDVEISFEYKVQNNKSVIEMRLSDGMFSQTNITITEGTSENVHDAIIRLDDTVSNINTALDAIIEIQNSLISNGNLEVTANQIIQLQNDLIDGEV